MKTEAEGVPRVLRGGCRVLGVDGVKPNPTRPPNLFEADRV